jgi:serine/threonine protein kinase
MKPAKLYPNSNPSYHRFRWRKGETFRSLQKRYRDPLKVAADESLRNNFAAQVTEREIRTCGFLRMHACKNIAKCRGIQCKDVMKVVDGGHLMRLDTKRVMKLVFKRYECDLHELITPGIRIDVKYCLESLAAGLKHMHALELVHCDLKPANIFVEADYTNPSSQPYEFVVGDFDSAAVTGSVSELKLGEMHWTRPKVR